MPRLTRSKAEDPAAGWSPDGRWTLFTSDCAGNKDVYVMHLDGSGVRSLTRSPAADRATSRQPPLG